MTNNIFNPQKAPIYIYIYTQLNSIKKTDIEKTDIKNQTSAR